MLREETKPSQERPCTMYKTCFIPDNTELEADMDDVIGSFKEAIDRKNYGRAAALALDLAAKCASAENSMGIEPRAKPLQKGGYEQTESDMKPGDVFETPNGDRYVVRDEKHSLFVGNVNAARMCPEDLIPTRPEGVCRYVGKLIITDEGL